ncbi:MAG: hypothetical protein JSS75_12225 [Bacteroidetes bacterium]|nr:hypothetical protein [Bacteroidota bacterium]
MANKPLNTDRMIDEALLRDSARLPRQSDTPDDLLLAALREHPPVATSVTRMSSGLFTRNSIKWVLAATGLFVIAVSSYFVFSNNVMDQPPAKMLTAPVRLQGHDTTTRSDSSNSKQRSQDNQRTSQHARPAQVSTEIHPTPSTPSLLMPSTPPKRYTTDSATLPLRDGHR